MMILGFLGAVVLVGALLAALVGGGAILQRQGSNSESSRPQGKLTAREVLDRRLARGDISREEYTEIRDQLES